ncbi:hypothetical protein WP3W18E02_26810 [Klebsiella sp. WP3-W18-ESBL-02]|nr:hypothetical protein WP3W18E02_26810 [Klebsiella sp. WP3-W18-ESBL-02]BBR21158.1 hypothetical protein WP3S18E05_26380 [Klebsiella sp. WP3-S18-ESBL-05]
MLANKTSGKAASGVFVDADGQCFSLNNIQLVHRDRY